VSFTAARRVRRRLAPPRRAHQGTKSRRKGTRRPTWRDSSVRLCSPDSLVSLESIIAASARPYA
jgi:hypothetical protein